MRLVLRDRPRGKVEHSSEGISDAGSDALVGGGPVPDGQDILLQRFFMNDPSRIISRFIVSRFESIT